jgi:hypothetical protein
MTARPRDELERERVGPGFWSGFRLAVVLSVGFFWLPAGLLAWWLLT